jgi:multidrug transporter EmrE-like cation transporter
MEFFQYLIKFFYKNFFYVLILAAAICSAFGNIYIKKSQSSINFLSSLFSLEFFMGITFYCLNLILFAFSLKYINVSKAYPILAGLGFVFLIILSNLILGEKLNILNYFGFTLVIIGIYFIAK